MAQTNYGGAIWTNHALERLSQRGISQENALRAFKDADSQFEGTAPGSQKFIKQFGDKKVTLIGKYTDQKEWIIISAWIDPPLPGSADERKQQSYREYRNAKGWKKLYLAIKRQLGL